MKTILKTTLILAMFILLISISGSVFAADVTTLQEFKDAVMAGGTVDLRADIALDAMVDITSTTTINGNGFSIDAGGLADRVFVTPDDFNGTFTLNNVSVTGFSKTLVTVAGNNAAVTINGGAYDAENNETHIVLAKTSAAVNVDGAMFKNVATPTSGAFAAIVASGGAVNVKNTTFENSRCAIFLANGGTLTEENITYTNNVADVYNQKIDTNTVYTESAFVASIKNGGKIVLGANIPLTATVMIPVDKSVEITGNGFDIDASGLADRVFVTEKTYTGTFTLNNVNVTGFSKTVVTTESGKLVINGGMFDANNNQTHIILAKTSTDVTIDGSTFKNVATSSSSVSSAVVASGGNITIKNSTFENNRSSIFVLNSATLTEEKNTFVNNKADVYSQDTNTNTVYTETALTESIKNGGIAVVAGDITLTNTTMPYELTDMLKVASNATLTISKDVTLVVGENAKIVNEGTIVNKGTIDKKGIVENIGTYSDMGQTMYNYTTSIKNIAAEGSVNEVTLTNADADEMNRIIKESIMKNEYYRNILLVNKEVVIELVFSLMNSPDEYLMKAFKDAMPDLSLAQFMNIDVVMNTGDEKMDLSELAEQIKISFKMPEDFENAPEGKERTFYILREHGQEITKLELTKNEDGTYSFYSDKFSTYAIAYMDIDAVVAPVENPETSDNIVTYAALVIIAVVGLGITGYSVKKSRK